MEKQKESFKKLINTMKFDMIVWVLFQIIGFVYFLNSIVDPKSMIASIVSIIMIIIGSVLMISTKEKLIITESLLKIDVCISFLKNKDKDLTDSQILLIIKNANYELNFGLVPYLKKIKETNWISDFKEIVYSRINFLTKNQNNLWLTEIYNNYSFLSKKEQSVLLRKMEFYEK